MEELRGSGKEAACYETAKYDGSLAGAADISALVCESEQELQGRIGNILKRHGYNVMFAKTAADAIAAMRFHLFDVVVVNELFETTNPVANEVLQYLRNQNMTTRRRCFVALTGRGFTTRDNMAAFSQSVNIVINTENMDEIGEIVKQGLADNASFYHVFYETLRKDGKI